MGQGQLTAFYLAADVPGDLNVVSLSKNERLKPGLAVRITTGAAMPLGADAVVPVEETLLVSESDDVMFVLLTKCVF